MVVCVNLYFFLVGFGIDLQNAGLEEEILHLVHTDVLRQALHVYAGVRPVFERNKLPLLSSFDGFFLVFFLFFLKSTLYYLVLGKVREIHILFYFFFNVVIVVGFAHLLFLKIKHILPYHEGYSPRPPQGWFFAPHF